MKEQTFVEVDIYTMKEDETYRTCPYCGHNMKDVEPITINDKRYPYDANYQMFNEAYSLCNYGIRMWWNEIHCCPNCKKEYYTVHEH